MSIFGTVEQAVEDLRNGKTVIVADDEDRENEGDLVCAAELVTPETINFMTLHGRGLICLALTGDRCDQLGLPQMTERNTEELATAFTVSIDAERRYGVTTGISTSPSTRPPSPPISAARGTSSPCGPGPAACCSGSARPRPAWTSRGWPASSRPGSSVRS